MWYQYMVTINTYPIQKITMLIMIIMIVVVTKSRYTWASPVISWFINHYNPLLTIGISTINHRIQPLINQLNAIDWGPHLKKCLMVCLAFLNGCLSEAETEKEDTGGTTSRERPIRNRKWVSSPQIFQQGRIGPAF